MNKLFGSDVNTNDCLNDILRRIYEYTDTSSAIVKVPMDYRNRGQDTVKRYRNFKDAIQECLKDALRCFVFQHSSKIVVCTEGLEGSHRFEIMFLNERGEKSFNRRNKIPLSRRYYLTLKDFYE